MRLFVGVALADEVARELAALVQRLRRCAGDGHSGRLRWTEPESWHVTLQFLGNTTTEQLECLKTRLSEVRCGPVAVELGELGAFDRAGVLFVDVNVTPKLAALQQRVLAATSQCGFIAEKRPFHPHITLSRSKGDGRHAQLQGLLDKAGKVPAFSRFTAHEFLLYESHLGPGGSRYEVRERFGLGVA